MSVGSYDHYKGARPLRTFTLYGFKFNVVRWRDRDKNYWRGYTALIHDGLCVSDDIQRNSEDPYEVQLARVFKSEEALRFALEEMHVRARRETANA